MVVDGITHGDFMDAVTIVAVIINRSESRKQSKKRSDSCSRPVHWYQSCQGYRGKSYDHFPIQELVDLPNLLLYSILLKFAFRFCPHLSTKISGLLAFASSIICFLCSGVRIIYLITPSVGILKCMPSSRSHETTIFEIDASFEFSSYLIWIHSIRSSYHHRLSDLRFSSFS